jgi:hypothetical protein
MFRHRRAGEFIAIVGLSFVLSAGLISSARPDDAAPAADAAPKVAAKEAEPVTTKDPQIALDDLELLLEPMTVEEIGTEAKGWFALVQAKEREISVAELDVRRKNREIAQLEKQKTAAAIWPRPPKRSRLPRPTRIRRRRPSTSRKRRKISPARWKPPRKRPSRRRRRPRRPPLRWPSKPMQRLRPLPPRTPGQQRPARRSCRRRATRTCCRKQPKRRRRSLTAAATPPRSKRWWLRARRKPRPRTRSRNWPNQLRRRRGPRWRRRRAQRPLLSPTPRKRPKSWPRRPMKHRRPRPTSRSSSSITARN